MATTYTLISSNTLSSSAASVTFSSIPSTYTDLVLRVSARGDAATSAPNFDIFINSDTATNYSATWIQGSGSATLSSRASNAAYGRATIIDGATETANTFSNSEFYFPNYTSTSAKPYSITTVEENNATAAYMQASAALYRGSSGITTISLSTVSGGYNFVSGSSFYLYGISKS